MSPPMSPTHLVVLSNQDEFDDLATRMSTDWWSGYSDLATPGTWRWVTNEDTFGWPVQMRYPWEPDQPDAMSQCGQIRPTGSLHDKDCTDAAAYICECDEYPDTPMNR